MKPFSRPVRSWALNLTLYVNGERAASSQAPAGHTFDLTNTQPLTIGSGAQGHFAGTIGDVRIYEGALAEGEVSEIRAEVE